MYAEGQAKKLINVYKSPIQVYNEVGEHILHLNNLLGRNISLNFKGTYICKSCNKVYNDLFRMGCCKKCFFESPLAGDSILRPEMSKAHLNIEDRDLEQEKRFQLQPHIVYLADAGKIKVGVTRSEQMHTRWMDQGAARARVIANTENRYQAGLIEVELKNRYSDKTNWKMMLKDELDGRDLEVEAMNSKEFLSQKLKMFFDPKGEECNFFYDMNSKLENIKSINLISGPEYEGVLCGLRGQYLIFSDGQVLNWRSHEGAIIRWEY